MISLFKNLKRKNSFKKIDKEFNSAIGKIAKLANSKKRNEEETRRWCIDILRNAMGYKDDQIETESKVLGQRVDIALLKNDEVFMVIECKAATVNLNNAAIYQAANYAIALGAEWAVVTNGHNWALYHVSPSRGVEPDVLEIFNIFLLDEDGISEEDAYCLHLLTMESIFSGETKMAFHEANCMTLEKLQAVLLSSNLSAQICKALEQNYKTSFGVSVSVPESEVRSLIDEIFELIE